RSRRTRAILRAVFHMPSLAWAVLGLGVLGGRLEGGNQLLSIVALIVFAASGIGNLAALGRPHFGGLILLGAAAMTLADLLLNYNASSGSAIRVDAPALIWWLSAVVCGSTRAM